MREWFHDLFTLMATDYWFGAITGIALLKLSWNVVAAYDIAYRIVIREAPLDSGVALMPHLDLILLVLSAMTFPDPDVAHAQVLTRADYAIPVFSDFVFSYVHYAGVKFLSVRKRVNRDGKSGRDN